MNNKRDVFTIVYLKFTNVSFYTHVHSEMITIDTQSKY